MQSNKDSFMLYAKKRLIEKNSKSDRECGAYFKNFHDSRKRKWNVKFGGFKW